MIPAMYSVERLNLERENTRPAKDTPILLNFERQLVGPCLFASPAKRVRRDEHDKRGIMSDNSELSSLDFPPC